MLVTFSITAVRIIIAGRGAQFTGRQDIIINPNPHATIKDIIFAPKIAVRKLFNVAMDATLDLIYFIRLGLFFDVCRCTFTPDASRAVHEHLLALELIRMSIDKCWQLSEMIDIWFDRSLKCSDLPLNFIASIEDDKIFRFLSD